MNAASNCRPRGKVSVGFTTQGKLSIVFGWTPFRRVASDWPGRRHPHLLSTSARAQRGSFEVDAYRSRWSDGTAAISSPPESSTL